MWHFKYGFFLRIRKVKILFLRKRFLILQESELKILRLYGVVSLRLIRILGGMLQSF